MRAPLYVRNRTIEWAKPGGGGGCAGGFKMLRRPDGHPPLIVGACPLGVCVVDIGRHDNHVVEYVPFGKFRVSNVAFSGGWLYVTGEGHLWRLRIGTGRTVDGEGTLSPLGLENVPVRPYG